MNGRWVLVSLLGALACQSKGSEAGAPPAALTAPAAPAPSGPGKVAPAGSCQAELEYLVPPQKYGDSDLIRAITIDVDQVFYRNMSDVFRVPLSGGAPVPLGRGPALSLSGTTVLWVSGDRLVTQSPGEPIFMAAAKTGGAWSNLVDLTAAKLGGGRDAATRILQGLGKHGVPKATRADFDGQTFYFAEVTRGKDRYAAASSVLKSVPLSGGEARTLYRAAGEIQEVKRVGDQLAFLLTAPPTPEQVKQNVAERKAKKYVFGVKGPSHVMSVPLAGGEAKQLLRIGPLIAGLGLGGVVLGADGSKLYVSGYRDEDLMKPGIFRVEVDGGGVEELDHRTLTGSMFVSGGSLVFIGSGAVELGKAQHGLLVLTGPRQGKGLTLAACITEKSTLHASAVSGKVALLGLFHSGTGLSGIAKIGLP
jgi:hypothetical protein